MKILMVCLGNICRSPLAEGVLRGLAQSEGLDWTVDSAGTGGYHVGEPPDPRSAAVAGKYGFDISGQRARKFHYSDLQNFDVIYAMDRQNYRDILMHADSDEERDRVRLLLDEVPGKAGRSVPDPYWDDDGFEQVYAMVREACEAILDKYR